MDLTPSTDRLQHTRLSRGLMVAVAFTFAGIAMASAQETIYVGGSGNIPVEVNLNVITKLIAPRLSARVILDPPGRALRSAFLLAPPAKTAAVEQKITFFAPTPKPAVKPKPVPAPEPKPVVTAMPAPSISLPTPIAPVTTPAPEPAPTMSALTLSLPDPAAPQTPAPQPTPLPQVTIEPAPELEPTPEPMPELTLAPTPAPAPAPAPQPVAAPVPEVTVAALTPETATTRDALLSISFEGRSADLPSGVKDQLQRIADQLNAEDTLRAQVKAYAGSATGSASSARRLSLSRALAVRSILIDFGVRSTRIDVRALGDRNEGGAPDRVDVQVINR